MPSVLINVIYYSSMTIIINYALCAIYYEATVHMFRLISIIIIFTKNESNRGNI